MGHGGKLTIDFNQELIVPEFAREFRNKSRMLKSPNEYSIYDAISIELTYMNPDLNDRTYYTYFFDLDNWTPNDLTIKFYFSEPLFVSTGL